MKRLENKIAVVTGASTGIGQGSAKVLAKEGAHVLALDISDELEKTVQSIIDGGVMAYTWPGEMLGDDRWKHSTK